MAVLDTFFILFKSDADDVDKGAKKAKGAVDDLESGISGADKASISLGSKLNALATTAVAAFGSVFAVTQLISSATGIASQSTELGLLSDVLGESASEIVNWGRAVENMGGDSKAFESSLRSLSGSLNDALISGPNAATQELAKMGISARNANGDMKTVLQLLPDLADKFQGLTRESALARGQALGLDQGTILLLMQGRGAVEGLVARQRGMNQVTDDQIDSLRMLGVRWNEYKNQISDSGTVLLSMFLPAIEKVEGGVFAFMDVIRENSDFALTFFQVLGAAVLALVAPTLAAAAPFIAIGAAVVAASFVIATLIEDIQAYAAGQDSMLGAAAERWTFVADGIELVKMAIEGVLNVVEILSSAFDALSFPDLAEAAGDVAGSFFDTVDKGFELRKKGFGALFEGAKGIFNEITQPDLKAVREQMTIMSSTPVNAMGAAAAAGQAGSTSNSTASVTVGEITIDASGGDPAEIAASVGSELKTQLSNVIENNDDGVAA